MEIRPSILLHSCCGPCSTAVIEKLNKAYNITVFFYNPNITDPEEYENRKANQKLFLENYRSINTIGFIEGDYDPKTFLNKVQGYVDEPEGGLRCSICFKQRLEVTADYAKKNYFAFFGTTLSVSPHKDAVLINSIGLNLSAEYDVHYLASDFKKQDGYQRSIQMAKEYHLYRQRYCGCQFSIPNKV